MFIFTRELRAIRRSGCVWRPVRITLKGDRGYGNDRTFCQPFFQIVIFWLTLGEADPPAIVVDCDGDMVGVLKCSCRAIKRGVIEVPLRRGLLPYELRKIV